MKPDEAQNTSVCQASKLNQQPEAKNTPINAGEKVEYRFNNTVAEFQNVSNSGSGGGAGHPKTQGMAVPALSPPSCRVLGRGT